MPVVCKGSVNQHEPRPQSMIAYHFAFRADAYAKPSVTLVNQLDVQFTPLAIPLLFVEVIAIVVREMNPVLHDKIRRELNAAAVVVDA